MIQTYHVRTGQRCKACGKDLWQSISGQLRCQCGQRLWIERSRDSSGLHFPYTQGTQIPKTFKGWLATTA